MLTTMNKYLILYCATPETLEHWRKQSQEQAQKGMEAWMQWQEARKEDLAEAGCPVGKNTRITLQEVKPVSNEVCGYSILLAESPEAAAKILEGNPHVKEPGAYLEVMNLVNMS